MREACSDCGVVRQIERAFTNEGIRPSADTTRDWVASGQRRGVFDRYTDDIDWSNAQQVRDLQPALEEILSWVTAGEYRDKIIQMLGRDGYSVDELGRLIGGPTASDIDIPLEGLTDPASILEHLDRIAATTDTDPSVAISGAKALIEATTKLVLAELGIDYDEHADVPVLVKAAQKALMLHPDALAPTAPGVEITKRILSNLSQLAVGVAELRNQYGPDHGRTRAVLGLGPRHARLAVGSSMTYCRMLLETLEVRRAQKPNT